MMNRAVTIGLMLFILAIASFAIRRWLFDQGRVQRLSDEAKLEALGKAAVEKARKDVAEFGWHFILIPGEEGSGFLFTIGLWQTYKHPEIIAFSPTEDPQRIIGRFTSVAKRIAAGERFDVGKTYDGLFGNYPGAFRSVHRDWYQDYLGTAGAFYGSFDFPTQELFWPDREGHFPWQPGFDKTLLKCQPLLHEARPKDV